MKKLSFLVIIIISLASCEKLSKEKQCPIVAPEQMPAAVTTTFAAKYPGSTVTTWFNKDNTGFVASFILNGNETKALFDNNGNFEKEDVEIENDNQKGDHQDEDSGCECELKDSEH